MILLDKLRLINWHYFLNVTADIKKITFLTGANGTGKSTIIDAMQLLLTGDTAGRNFNKAASEKKYVLYLFVLGLLCYSKEAK